MSKMASVNLALCSVNLAEAARQAMPVETKAEIYATAAITVRLAFPSALQFFAVSIRIYLAGFDLMKK